MRYSFDEWQNLTRVFFEVTPLIDVNGFVAEAEARRYDRLICTRARFPRQKFDHDPVRIRGVDHNYLLYERYYDGEGRGLAADVPAHINRASIHLIDMSRRYRSITEDVAVAGVCIPHDLIGYDPSRDPPYRSVPVVSPQGKMLDLAHGAFRVAVARERPDAPELSAAFLALVRTLMLNAPDTRSAEQKDVDRRPLLRTYIARHLADLGLSPAQICDELGLSRSVLYREFQRDGGVIRFITNRRLDRCFADLMATPARHGAVRRVAERWGFDHPGNFHRSFRDRFGMSPSDCLERDSSRACPIPGNVHHPVHEWLRCD